MSDSTLSIPITPSTPILTQLPSAQSAFTRKYTNPSLQSALQSLSPSLRQSLIDFDLKRVTKGQPPLSDQQTLLALQSAQSNQAATPPEHQGFLSRVATDVRSLIDVPHIVQGLANEVTELPSAPAKLSEVLGRGSPQAIIGGLSEVPGLRMVPGVNTASTLANEGPSGLLEHPVLTALDVLPYAKPALGAAAESILSRRPSVIAAREAGAEGSALRVAASTSPTVEHFATTPLATKIRTSFGSLARDLSQSRAAEETALQIQSTPDLPATFDSHPALTDTTAPIRAAINDAASWSRLIPEPRMAELTDRIQFDRTSVLSDPLLTDPERAFVNGYIDHAQSLADFKVQRDWLKNIDGEIYDRTDGARILASRRSLARVETMNSTRALVESAQPGVVPAIDPATIASEHLNKSLKIELATGYAHALDAAGFDARPVFEAIKDGNTPPAEAIRTAIDNPTPRPQLSQEELSTILRGFSRTDPSYARVLQDVQRGNYQGALETFRSTIGSRTRHVHPQSGEILDSLIRARDRQKFLDRTTPYNDRQLERAQTKNAKVESRILPARWIPTLEKLRSDRLLEAFSSDVNAQGLIRDGFPQLVTGLRDNPQLLRDIEVEVKSTVQELRQSGVDPVFVHRVSPSQVASINYPRITDAFRTPTSIRARTTDATPYIHDAAVALSHEGVEILSRLASESYISHILDQYGKTEVEALTPYVERGRQLNQADSHLSPAQHAQSLMQRAYTKYDPANIFPHQQASIATVPKETVFIPKTVEQSLIAQFHDQGFKFTAALDPIMNLFRMSVLPFAPRFHINNIGGGAMLLGVESPSAFANIQKAYQFVKSGEYAAVQGLPPSGLGSVSRDVIEWGHNATFTDKVLAAHSFKSGQTLARWIQESRAVTGKVTQAADYLYEFNGKVDDLYRATAYLTGRDKALSKGMTAAESEQAGVALVRKVLPEWDRQTPFERNIVRSVFPFYTFARFILNYAYRYPMDHPFRIAVTSSIARNELQDFGDSLPLQFAQMFFLGHPDSHGNVSALNIGAINPFQDVANYFTLAGFTGKVNPVISAAMEAVGVDPSKGTQDLYPDITYDPVTGRLKPSNSSFLSSLIPNIIPQSQLITALLGRNEDFKAILSSNPEAAAAMLRSSAGLPNLFRTVNPAQESFKAELQRQTNQSQVQNEALRTGDWSRAQQFPQLRAYFQQVASLMGTSPDTFQPFVANSTTSGNVESLKDAVAGLKP